MAGYEVGPVLAPGVRPWPTRWQDSMVVKSCLHATWETVLVPPYNDAPLGEAVRCTTCFAPRCGSARNPDPCMRVSAHENNHILLSGKVEKVVKPRPPAAKSEPARS